jgi:hypothetical protein
MAYRGGSCIGLAVIGTGVNDARPSRGKARQEVGLKSSPPNGDMGFMSVKFGAQRTRSQA